MSSYLRLSPKQLQQGYLKLNGIVAERHPFHVVHTYEDGSVLVDDPWEDMLQHWAITSEEVELEERQGSTTPIPWVRPERWRPDV